MTQRPGLSWSALGPRPARLWGVPQPASWRRPVRPARSRIQRSPASLPRTHLSLSYTHVSQGSPPRSHQEPTVRSKQPLTPQNRHTWIGSRYRSVLRPKSSSTFNDIVAELGKLLDFARVDYLEPNKVPSFPKCSSLALQGEFFSREDGGCFPRLLFNSSPHCSTFSGVSILSMTKSRRAF